MTWQARPTRANPGTPEALADQMVLIYHAGSCKIGELGNGAQCPERRCSKMKTILYHLMFCDRREICDFEGCSPTRSLKKHFRKCDADHCTPCAAVRHPGVYAQLALPRVIQVHHSVERRKLQIQLLEFLMHIHHCQSPHPRARLGDCNLANCEDLEDVLLHLPVCESASDCPFPGCFATRYVFEHWEFCGPPYCPVCRPLKLTADVENSGRVLSMRRLKELKFIAQHVEQLFHLYICVDQEQRDPEKISNCRRANCTKLRNLVAHLPQCDEKRCQVPHCTSSRRILSHWKRCTRPDCLTCISEPNQPPAQQLEPKENLQAGPSPNSTLATISTPFLPRMFPAEVPAVPLAFHPQRLKAVQRLLVLLLHAHKCSQRLKALNEAASSAPCALKQCAPILEVYNHLIQCTNYQECDTSQCFLARKILHHWQTCDHRDCQVCLPLTEAVRIKQAAAKSPSIPEQVPKAREEPDKENKPPETPLRGQNLPTLGESSKAAEAPMDNNVLKPPK